MKSFIYPFFRWHSLSYFFLGFIPIKELFPEQKKYFQFLNTGNYFHKPNKIFTCVKKSKFSKKCFFFKYNIFDAYIYKAYMKFFSAVTYVKKNIQR